MATIEEVQAELDTERTKIAGAQARIKELNEENKGHRLNAQNARTEAEAARADAERVAKETTAKLTATEKQAAEAMTQAQARVVNADLRLAAKDAGANDVADVLALMPRDRIKLDEAGEITNAADLIAGLKTAKPYLFGAASTSSTAAPPTQAPAKAKSAMDMTAEEYAAARSAAIRAR